MTFAERSPKDGARGPRGERAYRRAATPREEMRRDPSPVLSFSLFRARYFSEESVSTDIFRAPVCARPLGGIGIGRIRVLILMYT